MRHHLDRLIFTIAVLTAALTPDLLLAGEGTIRRSPRAVRDEYIVVLNDATPRGEVPALAKRLAAQHGGSLQRVWQDALKGFFIRMNEGQAQGLSHHPDVKYIEENAEMFLSSTASTNIDPACDPGPGVPCTTSDNRLWHLDVLDQNSAIGTSDYSYCETGSGVYVYVVDLGVMRSHREFNNDPNKVLDGYDASGDPPDFPAYDPCRGPGTLNQPPDGQVYPSKVRKMGHGTGVASLVNGRSLGVAKDAKVVPIKVSPCVSYGARTLDSNTYNTYYGLNEIVHANSAYYKVTQGGTTGASDTYPHNGWPWPNNGITSQHWGSVELQYVATSLPTAMTVQMTIEGLDWILRPVSQGGNPNPKSPAVVTLSTYRPVSASNPSTLTRATRAAAQAQLRHGSRRSAAAVPTTYTRTKEPVVHSTSTWRLTWKAATTPSATREARTITVRLRRGTSPALLPRANQAGSAPSRPSAAPSLAAPAKYAFIVPSVSSVAATAVMARPEPPTPTARSSASGAGVEPVAGPRTSTLAVATAR